MNQWDAAEIVEAMKQTPEGRAKIKEARGEVNMLRWVMHNDRDPMLQPPRERTEQTSLEDLSEAAINGANYSQLSPVKNRVKEPTVQGKKAHKRNRDAFHQANPKLVALNRRVDGSADPDVLNQRWLNRSRDLADDPAHDNEPGPSKGTVGSLIAQAMREQA